MFTFRIVRFEDKKNGNENNDPVCSWILYRHDNYTCLTSDGISTVMVIVK